MIRKLIAVGGATVIAAVTGVVVFANTAAAGHDDFRAELKDPRGRSVGTVNFRVTRSAMYVDARLWSNRYVDGYVDPGVFHGFHVHANNDPVNGRGCQADPNASRSTWFVSADGHLSATGQDHGAHNGDLPSPLVLDDGTARLSFTTDRIEPDVLRRTAVILHAKPDNFGNVPVGTAPDQYTANSSAAPALTARTGNASDRVACGVVRRS